MATLLSLAVFSLSFFLFLSPSAGAHHRFKKPPPSISPASSPKIQQACKATQLPQLCKTYLVGSDHLPSDPNPLQIIQASLSISADNIKKAQPMAKAILDVSGGDKNRSEAAHRCLELLHNSDYRTASTADALPLGRTKDARAWMSASLAYQYDCYNGLSYVNGTKQVNDVMAFIDSLMQLTSNALSMVMAYDIFANQTASWGPPKTERDGYWEPAASDGSDFIGGFPADLKPDVKVCKAGGPGCQYETVQEAVNAAPDNAGAKRFVILIKAGVYEETVRIPLEKRNVVFLGEGMGKTIITGSGTVPATSTYNSATVAVIGDGFMARDLTIQNTAGPVTHQAVAFRLDSDLSIIENCEFLGNQDTLYAHTLRQYYKLCHIEGNVDFIFGNAAAVFDDCTILVRPRQQNPQKGENNPVTAHGRTDPAQSTGFVFQNCLINGTDQYMALYHQNPKVHRNFLGRPWKQYSRTVYIHCNLEALISPEGWLPFKDDFALNTLYYGEFQNSGPGSNSPGRVKWSNQVPPEHVNSYSVQNFIQGNDWITKSA